jgi:hypothetical protein
MTGELTSAQRETVARIAAEIGATETTTDRDEPHDAHVFVAFYRGAAFLTERVIEADGSEPDDDE